MRKNGVINENKKIKEVENRKKFEHCIAHHIIIIYIIWPTESSHL